MIIEGPTIELPAPCPWCGSTVGAVDQIERFGTPPDGAVAAEGWWCWAARCASCGAEGPPSKVSADGALRSWARRSVAR